MANPNELPGDREPVPPDLIFGHWQFGLTPETLTVDRHEEETILAEDGSPEAVIAHVRRLYDKVTAMEQSGLRGNDLFLTVAQDQESLALIKRYYGFFQNRPWRDRFQSVFPFQ